MTKGEQKVLWRGVAAGALMGLGIGGIIALFIAMMPGPEHMESRIEGFKS